MKFALRLAVSAGVLTVLALLLPWGEVGQAVSRMSGRIWLAILAAYLLGHALNAVKWALLVNAGRSRLPLLAALRFHYAGLFANMWLPGIVGGDVLRAVLASRVSARPEAVVLGALADRFIDTVSMALLLLAGGVLLHGALGQSGAGGILLVLGLRGAACGRPTSSDRPASSAPTTAR